MEKEEMNSMIGEKIRKIRQERKISQSELAEIIGVKQSNLSKIENGINALTIDKLYDICEYFEISIDDFLKNVSYGFSLDKLEEFVSAEYCSYSLGEQENDVPHIWFERSFFEYLIQTAYMKHARNFTDEEKKQFFKREKELFFTSGLEATEHKYVGIVPVPIKAIFPSDETKEWNQWDLIKAIEHAYINNIER